MTAFFCSLPALGLAAWGVYGLWKLFEKAMGQRLSAAVRFYALLLPAVLLLFPAAWLKPPVAVPPTPVRTVRIITFHPEAVSMESSAKAAVPSGDMTAEALRLLLPTAKAVWALGASVLLAVHAGRGLAFSRRIQRNARPYPKGEAVLRQISTENGAKRIPRLLRTRGIWTPMLVGVLRPVILLPEAPLNAAGLKLALAHEYTHYRCRDLWVKLFLLLAACIQWFNPLGWLLVRAGTRLCEEACDQRVAQGMDHDSRRRYGLALLEALGRTTPGGISAALSGSGRHFERRLKLMMEAHPTKKQFLALAIAVATALGCAGTVLAVGLTPAEAETPPSSEISIPREDPVLEPTAESGGSETGAESQEDAPILAPTKNDSLLWPLAGGIRITAEFQPQSNLPAHLGLDMTVDGDKEAAILAAADGTVEEAEYSAKKGYYLRIRHGNGLETLYAHCSSLLAEEGDSVSAGEQVAVMGSTGYSTGPHCHFEVLVNGQSVDPLSYLPTAE
ncbi:MAG: M56 family metallopeptidase [Candidatus Merdivicinus sp.]|jgi:beta-lactamase regulating signal transducer with metallopeptidase domain